MISDLAKVNKRIEMIRKKGFGIAIDDFGVGYSSLSQLKTLCVSELKIDKSFINVIQNEHEIVEAVIGLGGALGIDVLAEGVETKEQFEVLKRMGIKRFQGFYFYKPLTISVMSDVLKKPDKKVNHSSQTKKNNSEDSRLVACLLKHR
jgi:EAL domain-containing protein (putative c-di-GMP-specific phosphodiesterase class I)